MITVKTKPSNHNRPLPGIKMLQASCSVLRYVAVSAALLCFIAATTSCNSSLPVADYLKWVELPENGLHQVKTFGGIDFSIQYKPLEYVLILESDRSTITKTAVAEKQQQRKGMEYYTIRIGKNNKSGDVLLANTTGDNDYYKRVDYYSFAFQNAIYRVQHNDTLPCTLFAFVPNYGIAPYVDFAIGFDVSDTAHRANDEDITIHITDDIFNNGTLKFRFNQSDIKRIPKLLTR